MKKIEKQGKVANEEAAERNERTRHDGFEPSARPSQTRSTVGHSEPCDECGATLWEDDEIRGEVVCGGCGLVVEDHVIDPRAEWVNHGDGPDRSRVGMPSTLTLSDKGLNTRIDRCDLLGGRARMHGIKGKALRDWRRRAVIDERSKTRSSRSRNLVKAMQFIRDRGGLPPRLQQEAASLYRKACRRDSSPAVASVACPLPASTSQHARRRYRDASRTSQGHST